MRLGPLDAEHRTSVAAILESTNVFSSDEVAVALELFDSAVSDVDAVRRSSGPTSALDIGRGGTSDRASRDYECFGAFDDDDTLVGYACFGPTPSTDGTYDLYWLAVHPDAQRLGVGRALVRTVENNLAARGARLLVVETSSRADYDDTRTFYTRAGYTEAARIRDFYRPADDRIIYTTRLTSRERGAATR